MLLIVLLFRCWIRLSVRISFVNYRYRYSINEECIDIRKATVHKKEILFDRAFATLSESSKKGSDRSAFKSGKGGLLQVEVMLMISFPEEKRSGTDRRISARRINEIAAEQKGEGQK